MRLYIKTIFIFGLLIGSFFIGQTVFGAVQNFESYDFGTYTGSIKGFEDTPRPKNGYVTSLNSFEGSKSLISTSTLDGDITYSSAKAEPNWPDGFSEVSFWFNFTTDDYLSTRIRYYASTTLMYSLQFLIDQDVDGELDDLLIWDGAYNYYYDVPMYKNNWYEIRLWLSSSSTQINIEINNLAGNQIWVYEDITYDVLENPIDKIGFSAMKYGSSVYFDYFYSVPLSFTEQPWTGWKIPTNESLLEDRLCYDNIRQPTALYCDINQVCELSVIFPCEDTGKMAWLFNSESTQLDENLGGIISIGSTVHGETTYTYEWLLNPITDFNAASGTSDKVYLKTYDTETDTEYNYPFIEIFWIYTDESVLSSLGKDFLVKLVEKSFQNVFPLSILNRIDIALQNSKTATGTRVALTVNDFLPDTEYQVASSSNGTILKANILEDNLPIWNTKIYPLMEDIIWIACGLWIIYILLGTSFGTRPTEKLIKEQTKKHA